MKTWTLSLAAVGCALAINTARGDQCAWIGMDQAEKAQQLLAKYPKVIEYCEPCGQKAPGAPFTAKDVEIVTPQDGYREVQIGGKGIDLAYTFVKVSSTKYKNLAKLAGCPAQDVSKELTIADETPNGVLISPEEQKQPEPPTFASPPPLLDPLPPPPVAPIVMPPPQYTYHSTTIVQPIPWLVLALAVGGGFVTGSAFTLLLMTLRTRRRAMRPRATDLPTS
jgi:hypothetical protein